MQSVKYISALVALSLLTSCGSDETENNQTTAQPSYYFHIEHRSTLTYTPDTPMTFSYVQSESFTTDALDNFFSSEGQVRIKETSYSYDANNNLDMEQTSDYDTSALLETTSHSYEFNNNNQLVNHKEIRKIYNVNSNSVTREVSFDNAWANGLLLTADYRRTLYSNATGEASITEVLSDYEANSQGRVSAVYDNIEGVKSKNRVLQYTGNALSVIDYFSPTTGELTSKRTYASDSKNNVTSYVREIFDGGVITDVKTTYFIQDTVNQVALAYTLDNTDIDSNSISKIVVNVFYYGQTDSCGNYFDVANKFLNLHVPTCVTDITYHK